MRERERTEREGEDRERIKNTNLGATDHVNLKRNSTHSHQ